MVEHGIAAFIVFVCFCLGVYCLWFGVWLMLQRFPRILMLTILIGGMTGLYFMFYLESYKWF